MLGFCESPEFMLITVNLLQFGREKQSHLGTKESQGHQKKKKPQKQWSQNENENEKLPKAYPSSKKKRIPKRNGQRENNSTPLTA